MKTTLLRLLAGISLVIAATYQSSAQAPVVNVDSIRAQRCGGLPDGGIFLTVTGAVRFNWSTGATTEDLINVLPGLYTITAYSASNDSTVRTFSVAASTSIPISVRTDSLVNVTCYGDSNGAAYISVFGGAGARYDTARPGIFSSNFSSSLTRGYWFTAPSAFTITALFVPTTVGTTPQNIQVVRFTSGPPIAWPTTPGTAFTTLYYGNNIASTTWVPVSINIAAGDVIGIIGARGTGATMNNSYAVPGIVNVNIAGTPTACERLVYQNSIGTAPAASTTIVRETGTFSIAQIDFTYSYAGGGGYSYLWSTGDTTQDVTRLRAATHTVSVSDIAGCRVSQPITITQNDSIAISDSITNVLCFGDSTGAIDVSVTGGVPPYRYNWSTGDTTQDIRRLRPGTYTLTVTDSKLCQRVSRRYTIVEFPTLSVTVDSTKDVLCHNARNGSIYISVSGGLFPYSYSWNGVSAPQDLIGIDTGSYSCLVSDSNGCRTFVPAIRINQPSPISIEIDSISHNKCFGECNGYIAVEVSGGFGLFDFNWSNGDTTDTNDLLCADFYNLTVTDENACTAELGVTEIIQPDSALQVRLNSLRNPSCISTTDGLIDLIVSGGTLPYSMLWNTGARSEDLLGIGNGTYTVLVTDAFGCTQSSGPYNLNATLGTPVVDLGSDTVVCAGYTLLPRVTGTVTSYEWSNGSNLSSIAVSGSGVYWVKAGNNCGIGSDAVYVEVLNTPIAGFGLWSYDRTVSFSNLSIASRSSNYSWNFGDGNTSTISSPSHTYTSSGIFVVTLTVTNICGTSTYTDTAISVALSIEDNLNGTTVQLWPNPVQSTLQLSVKGISSETVEAVIVDVKGSIVREEIIKLNAGHAIHSFETESMAAGVYFLHLKSENFNESLRFIKQ